MVRLIGYAFLTLAIRRGDFDRTSSDRCRYGKCPIARPRRPPLHQMNTSPSSPDEYTLDDEERQSLSPSSSSLPSASSAFAELEHRNWQRGVGAYDTGFGPLTRRAIPTLLEKAGFPPGAAPSSLGGGGSQSCDFLDVATGPGYVVSSAVQAAGGDGSGGTQGRRTETTYTALDFSSNFLGVASGRLSAEHPGVSVNFVEGSAESMPFGDKSFDCIACNFGVLHLGRPDSFFREAFRCLRPGGRLSFSVWAAPPKTEALDMILTSVKERGNADVPLPEGPPFFLFADGEVSRRALEEAGFVDVDSTEVTAGMEWTNVANADDLYDIFLEGTARTRELLVRQTEEATRAIREDLAVRYQERTNGGRHRPLRMPAIVSSGRKPH